ncbi:MAG: CoA-binding protein [Actinomycetota bacterium]|nr:CoA-binding protein [Actinomycetota bacterium]
MLAAPTWAVVGCSDDPRRTSYAIAEFLQRNGKRIIPVNPHCTEILGETCYPSLAEVPEPIDVVDVFRRSALAGEVADAAIAVGARAIWFQLGVVDQGAYERARAAGVDMVMDTCPKIEWAAHGPR